jgi:hypothetical protein
MPDVDPPVEYARLYVYQGHVTHLVNVALLGNRSNAPAACCYSPTYPWEWLGPEPYGKEKGKAQDWPLCLRCRKRLAELGIDPDAA